MIRRLRVRFVLVNMAFVTVMLAAIFATVLGITRGNLERESLRMMQTIAVNPFQAGPPGQAASGDVRLPYFVVQVGRDGELLGTGGGYYDLSDDGLLEELVRETDGADSHVGVLPERGLRYLRSETPVGWCIVCADLSSETRMLEGLMTTCAAIAAGSFLAFLLLSVFLSRWAVRPIARAWNQQRRFVADVSHELKTPLTVILSNAELLGADKIGEETRARSRENVLAVARQMRELVERLLELARYDAGKGEKLSALVDWGAVVEDAVLPFEPLLYERGMTLETAAQPGLLVQGDANRLAELTTILLDNAGKYGVPGVVEVKLRQSGRRYAELCVSNPGSPIAGDELERIFDRFYRADKARSGAGSGLGLSIAETIAREHRGKIWAESKEGKNRFLVRLPLADRGKGERGG